MTASCDRIAAGSFAARTAGVYCQPILRGGAAARKRGFPCHRRRSRAGRLPSLQAVPAERAGAGPVPIAAYRRSRLTPIAADFEARGCALSRPVGIWHYALGTPTTERGKIYTMCQLIRDFASPVVTLVTAFIAAGITIVFARTQASIARS
jgi:hypothetical protein